MKDRHVQSSEDETEIAEERLPSHSPEGVDLTLIRWMLTLTPIQRLEVLQENVRSILHLRHERSTKS
jgi:hypothetical protein